MNGEMEKRKSRTTDENDIFQRSQNARKVYLKVKSKMFVKSALSNAVYEDSVYTRSEKRLILNCGNKVLTKHSF